MSDGVLVVGEVDGATIAPTTLEATGAARALGVPAERVTVLLVGSGARAAAGGAFGAGRVVVADDPRLDGASVAAVATVAVAEARRRDVEVLLVAASTFGRDLAGRAAARWDAGVASGVTELARDGTSLRVRRPVFGGRAFETLRLSGPRSVVSVRPHAFAAVAAGGPAPTVETTGPVELPNALLGPRRLGVEPVGSAAGPSLGDAAIVVAGGRGLRAAENFHLVEELAQALGAAVGASRAVTDAGWRPASYQVGQTGRAVSPQLYIAVGISGAIQHLVGMVSSRVIVAINSDATAPIFRVADYGIVGDLFEIVPALTREVQRVRGH